jgi:RNA polymerase sigma-B factor
MTILMDRNVDALLLEYHRTGDERAREAALVELMPLVRALASRYSGRGEPLEDLIQVGSVGLIKAVDRFDVDRGVEFSSYAVPTIVGEIRRHFRDKAWAMHVPRRLKELSVRLSRVLDELTTELGRSPTVAELAEAVPSTTMATRASPTGWGSRSAATGTSRTPRSWTRASRRSTSASGESWSSASSTR